MANKFPGVRAVNCHDALLAEMSRRTMDANVLCLSADLLSQHVIETMVETWLSAPFEDGRHTLRLHKVAAVEQEVLARYKEHLLGTASDA